MELTRKEYYLWKSFHAKKPWDRKYRDLDFLATEIKRIKEVGKWYASYIKTKEGTKLREVCYYCIPVEISTSWESSVLKEGFHVKGLTALYNDCQLPLLMLIPRDDKLPKDYSLIRIISSRKKVLLNKKLPLKENCAYAIILEEWEELPADSVYKDIPYEKRVVSKILYEGLNHDEHTAKSLQSPIISSPIVLNGVGGVSFASLLSDTPFALELNKTLQRMLPPEQRTLSPSKSLVKGNLIEDRKGIQFHVAERPPKCNNILSCSEGINYRTVNKEIVKRHKFNGEYSFVSSITSRGSSLDVFRTLLRRFTKTEITAFNINRLKEADVNLEDLIKNIDLQLYLNIVNCKQVNPRIDEKDIDKKALLDIVRKDWDIFLPEMGYNTDEKSIMLNIRAKQTVENLLRVAQSLARAELKQEVEEKHVKEARQMFKTNAEEFVAQPIVKQAKYFIRKQKRHERVDAIRTLLENGNLTAHEMWEELKEARLYKDMKDLQNLLDWLEEHGIIFKIESRNNRYNVI